MVFSPFDGVQNTPMRLWVWRSPPEKYGMSVLITCGNGLCSSPHHTPLPYDRVWFLPGPHTTGRGVSTGS